jgi:hypothetical protein
MNPICHAGPFNKPSEFITDRVIDPNWHHHLHLSSRFRIEGGEGGAEEWEHSQVPVDVAHDRKELFEGPSLPRLCEFGHALKEDILSPFTDGHGHGVGVDIETYEWYDWTVDLLLHFVRYAQLIPEEEEFSLICQEITAIWRVVQDIPGMGKGHVVIYIDLEVPDRSREYGNPGDKGCKGESNNV